MMFGYIVYKVGIDGVLRYQTFTSEEKAEQFCSQQGGKLYPTPVEMDENTGTISKEALAVFHASFRAPRIMF